MVATIETKAAPHSLNKRVLLVSNNVFHYRIAIYNYLNEKFMESGYELIVITNKIEKHTYQNVNFAMLEMPFDFFAYKNAVAQVQPAVVILFLHIKNVFVWPLLAWLKLRKIKVIYWNHGINLKTPRNILKRCMFSIFHTTSDAIILYSAREKKYINKRYWHKIFVANNTLDFHTFPCIRESKKAIKRELNIPFDKVVLFVGRITKNKRLDDLIRAAAYLDKNVGVVIVGNGRSSPRRQFAPAATAMVTLSSSFQQTLRSGSPGFARGPAGPARVAKGRRVRGMQAPYDVIPTTARVTSRAASRRRRRDRAPSSRRSAPDAGRAGS